ncbi:arsenosugar biosynthesis radical SAM (seleno)protein ArsS [Simiduia agarivorans]|uniref:Radical SAM protein n=1 Tax=Simiduia agarivorans (strain DSM 21679 / JCM 13881 / BCRC 17597 / SA1) TaxID=1117647 RepID=K4KEM4_SIMAS|nr:arsenosugar biosynthesis radical SAM (seleno)protein ArsS [Simiduia agarivorans]AFU97509.2 hypothetical protein M5M_01410 [Simiduia agarivorans SA1 = DSM 21679]
MQDTTPLLRPTDFPAISRSALTLLQVNLGYLCNLSCTHCHVNAGPKRTELMDKDTLALVLEFVDQHQIQCVDMTGGAPEMNPHFRALVKALYERDVAMIDRCNLTILNEPVYEDMAEFLARHRVNVVASLPCYSEKNVEQQRGKGIFNSSINALKKLNALGYGRDPALKLDLVYNPNGAFLPPSQQMLERDYKQQLKDNFAIDFNQLLTITNMPISRFGAQLLAKDGFDQYMRLLKENFSEANLASLMCKSLISVDWQGFVYDCDFNQMLAMPMHNPAMIASSEQRLHLRDLLAADTEGWPIAIGEHCYGCTAGQGSSCGGALG